MTTFRLDDLPDDERYRLTGRMEILSVLQSLVVRNVAVSVLFTGGRDSLLTRLLRADGDGVVFDGSSDAAVNRRLLASPRLIFSTRPGGVLVQFSSAPARTIAWDDGDAIAVPLPERLTRLQRRESFRVLAPVARPIPAEIELPELGLRTLPLHDISVGGVGLTPTADVGALGPGLQGVELVLALADGTRLPLSGDVRHLTPVTSASGQERLRLGVALHPKRSQDAALHRLVVHLDQERRRLTGE